MKTIIQYMGLTRQQVSLINDLASKDDKLEVSSIGDTLTKATLRVTLRNIRVSTIFLPVNKKEHFEDRFGLDLMNEDRIIYVIDDTQIKDRFEIMYNITLEEPVAEVKEQPKEEPKTEIVEKPIEVEPVTKPSFDRGTHTDIVPPQIESTNYALPNDLSEAHIVIIKQNQEIKKYNSEKENFTTQIVAIQQLINSLKASNQTLTMQNEENDSIITKLKYDVNLKETELADNKERITILEDRIRLFTDDVREKDKKITDLGIKILAFEELETTRQEMESDLTEAIRRESNLKNKISKLEDDLTQERYSKLKVEKELETIKSNLEQSERTLHSNSIKIASLEEVIRTSTTKTHSIESEINAKDSELSNANNKLSILTKQLLDKEKEINELTKQSLNVSPTIVEDTNKIDELNVLIESKDLLIEELSKKLKDKESSPKILDVHQPKEFKALEKTHVNRSNISINIRGGMSNNEKYFSILMENSKDCILIDLDNDTLIDTYYEFTATGNPNRWLKGKYLDLNKIKATSKSKTSQSMIITSLMSGIKYNDLLSANWGTLLNSLPTDIPVVINLGSISNKATLEILENISTELPFSLYIGDNAFSERACFLTLKGINASIQYLGNKDNSGYLNLFKDVTLLD